MAAAAVERAADVAAVPAGVGAAAGVAAGPVVASAPGWMAVLGAVAMRHSHTRNRAGHVVVGLFVLTAIGLVAMHPWVLLLLAGGAVVGAAAYVATRRRSDGRVKP